MPPGHVVYGVIPRRFSAAGLAGIEEKLPELRELGVTALWLSPIFEHVRHDFGYGMTDYLKVDPEHGAEEDLKRLVDAALQVLRSCRPDLLVIAEASTLDGFYHHAGFDAAHDWSHELRQWAWSDAFQTLRDRLQRWGDGWWSRADRVRCSGS